MAGSSDTTTQILPSDWSAEVLRVEPCPWPNYRLVLRFPESFPAHRPGQFLMLEAGSSLEPYLRRAFSIHQVEETEAGLEISVLAKIVGRGTRRLAEVRTGDRLRALGPLGRPFGLPEVGPVVLVAGGVGSAPLWTLGEALVEHGIAFDFFYGARHAGDLARADGFRALTERSGGKLWETTEDGSAGTPGLVTEPLSRALSERPYRALYTCGPMGLMAALAHLCEERGLPAQAALETPMGCGFGACLGCAVPRPEGGYALCCRDGPAFDVREVAWQEL